MSPITNILRDLEYGDPAAAEQLLPLVYDELRRLAEAKLCREKPGQMLQATALVHEAYLRLVQPAMPAAWNGRHHFFGAAAEAMRRILVENARRRMAAKHGGAMQRCELTAAVASAPAVDQDNLLDLDDALRRLESHDPLKGELVKLRYFAGLTMSEAAETLGIGLSTAEKYWTFAKCWLRSEMEGSIAESQRDGI